MKLWLLRDYEHGGSCTWERIRTPWCLFAGEMGVARAESGVHSTIPPCVTGGDIDAHHVAALPACRGPRHALLDARAYPHSYFTGVQLTRIPM